ncbi:MAG: glutamate--tRNA ligase [bacterium]
MKIDNETTRTRFAPSPTGMLHLGNANTALFNYLLARHHNGTVVLRIEDTDVERSEENYERQIIDDLRWLGLDWDEGPEVGGAYAPYRQSERLEIYNEHIQRLLDGGYLYRCFCTKEQLQADRDEAASKKRPPRYAGRCRSLSQDQIEKNLAEGIPFTLRFRTPHREKIVVNDLIRGDILFNAAELDDFILVRSNGIPIFLLTNLVDDVLMKITHVVRGEDHISNTPKQILIARALGYDTPLFLHTAIILGADRTKLSKRHGAVSVSQFRDEGFLPETMINYLAFLGWNPKDEREVFSLQQLIEEYSIEAMSKNPSVFDHQRLRFLNGQWMQKIEPARVTDLCAQHLVTHGYISGEQAKKDKEHIAKIVAAIGTRLKTISDVVTYGDFFFTGDFSYQEDGVKKHFQGEETAHILQEISKLIETATEESPSALEALIRDFTQGKNIDTRKIIHPLRLALTGKTVGPGLFETMTLLGKDEVTRRIARAVDFISSR